MLKSILTHLTPLDWLGLGWFLFCWLGYVYLAEHSAWSGRGLIGVMHGYRLEWSRRLVAREMRVSDAALIGNLMNSVSFYANTTIYIIAGLFAVLGTLDKVMSVAAELPFGPAATRDVLELKLLLLFVIFVVAYFKFTWSMRQFNLLSILVGAAPVGDCAGDPKAERHARKLAATSSSSGEEFNRGIRAYYFGLAALTWVINPLLFLAMTTAIVLVLYRRDYASHTVRSLRDD